jgi:hypothetical protein
LAKKSILPSNVIYLKADVKSIYEKTFTNQDNNFGANRNVLRSRIQNFIFNMPYLVAFYSKYYNSVTEIESTASKWYIEDICVSVIKGNL